MNADDIRFLSYYLIPKDWTIHLIDRRTDEKQFEQIQRIIENAQLLAFDTETMPSFYHSNYQRNQNYKWQNGNWDLLPSQTPQYSCISKPSLLQVAVRSQNRNGKNVLLFDLQELFDQTNIHFRKCNTSIYIHNLIQLIFNHTNAYKISQSLLNDLAQLKCSYDEECFHTSKLHHCIELSDIYRKVFPNEKDQQIYSLQRMTAMTLHCQLDKKQQCANWSKRPLTQSLKDYAAMDVIVMIDIYERLKTRIQQELNNQDNETLTWEEFQNSIEISIDLSQIVLYQCICGERFITNKTRNKHARTCIQEQQRIEQATINEKHSRKIKTKKIIINNNDLIKPEIPIVSTLPKLDLNASPPCGRGYIPPALKRAYQSMNQISLYEEVRCSSAFDEFNQLNENRPPDAQYFLEDDDTEVAQAFGLEIMNISSKPKRLTQINQNQSNVSLIPVSKQNLKIAAYPPKNQSLSLNIQKKLFDENDLLDRLKDDFDSQPDFHCHLFGLGGRGRSSSMYLSPPEPFLNKRNYYT
ncbi:unnamed protein product [Rotaria sordida]|uniref:3'-5' exonuclease domain-containing protein n=2 Tax=Rotaria sordida TaxID=392033 RepID=A0A818XB48_9BILA|nr:unnamed protein product [Rotaria sordida]CAF1202836.1 unnamed protein product [Rotaria sordida]CAF3734623.1 unnamed protein product [Rotaria sordida]CAF3878238.1 unnamed protein product [Rotaria sordida]